MLFLFGSKTEMERIGDLDIACPHCKQRPCGLYWQVTKATAYLISVATLKRTYVFGCAQCGNFWAVDQTLARSLHQKIKPEVANSVTFAASAAAAAGDTVDDFMDATESGDSDKIKQVVKSGLDVNTKDGYGQTALLVAAEAGKDRAVRQLLKLNADRDARDNNGKTALLRAIEAGHPRVISLLLEAGANVNVGDRNGYTPLIRAVEKGDRALVEQLLQRGADVRAVTNNGFSAEMRAFVSGHSDLVALLQSKK